MSGQDSPCECLPHWQFWVGLAGMAAGLIVSYTGLSYDVERLKLSQQRSESESFTNGDWERERALIQKEVLAQQAYSQALCREVRRLAIELKRVPTNGCDRP